MNSHWREEQGERGGKRWVNTQTGKVQYHPPGEERTAKPEEGKQGKPKAKQERMGGVARKGLGDIKGHLRDFLGDIKGLTHVNLADYAGGIRDSMIEMATRYGVEVTGHESEISATGEGAKHANGRERMASLRQMVGDVKGHLKDYADDLVMSRKTGDAIDVSMYFDGIVESMGNTIPKGNLSGSKKEVAKVVDSAAFDAHIKQHKTPELYRGVPKKEHGEQFKTGDLRQGKGAYGPGIYVGYGYNGRDTASNAAGDEGVMVRMTLTPEAKVMSWDEAESTWEKEGKNGEFGVEEYDGSEKAIAAWAKSKGIDAMDVKHNEFMNVLNPKVLIVEAPKDES